MAATRARQSRASGPFLMTYFLVVVSAPTSGTKDDCTDLYSTSWYMFAIHPRILPRLFKRISGQAWKGWDDTDVIQMYVDPLSPMVKP